MTEKRLKYGESRSMRGTYKNYFYIVFNDNLLLMLCEKESFTIERKYF